MSLLFKGRVQGAALHQIGLMQRIQMFFAAHLRQALSSLGDLWRTPASTLMTVAVLGLSITLPSTLYLLVKNAEQVTSGWDQAAEISLFLKKDTSAAQAQQLITRLETWPEITGITHIPASLALEEFKQLSGFGDALSLLDSNPLPDVLLVTPAERHAGPEAAHRLLTRLQSQREVELGKLDIEWLERIHSALNIVRELVTMIALLLFLSVVLIVGNTIRLNILNRRPEILVLKLIGATDAFIHRPFLYTGIWFGLLGGVVAWITVALLLWWMGNSIGSLTAFSDRPIELSGLSLSVMGWMLGVSVFLGLTGSLISVQRHVRAIEPS